jgi:hypothetical protein
LLRSNETKESGLWLRLCEPQQYFNLNQRDTLLQERRTEKNIQRYPRIEAPRNGLCFLTWNL